MEDPSRELPPWLLLVHHLPTEPSRLRVRTWRRLQDVGAVAVKNSVYVLPNSSETREDFEWIRAEIVAQGGEAMVLEARAVDEISSGEIRDALVEARRADWQRVYDKCQALLAACESGGGGAGERAELRRRLRALRAEAAKIDKVDYLRAPGRNDVLSTLERIDDMLDPTRPRGGDGSARRSLEEYRGRVWLTRPRPGVDRMASAWLIRRFIDPEARFRFSERIPGDENVVPFDMYGVELGHRGESITFETLLLEFGLGDPALSRIARIVHELDLRSDPLTDPEAVTLGRLIDGLRSSYDEDDRLLEHGGALFEALYASFSSEAT